MRFSNGEPHTWPLPAARSRESGSPIVFGPRIPDFLSRLVALSNFMRLSLRESRIRGCGRFCMVGNPGNAGANMGHPAIVSGMESKSAARYRCLVDNGAHTSEALP